MRERKGTRRVMDGKMCLMNVISTLNIEIDDPKPTVNRFKLHVHNSPACDDDVELKG